MSARRAVAVIASVVALACTALASASMPIGPDPVTEEWPVWPYKTSCFAPSFDPVQVFRRPATAELGSRPGEVALREAIEDPKYAGVGLNRRHWRSVAETETEAVFVTGVLSTPFGTWWTRFVREGEGWKWSGSGNCVPQTVLHGLPAVSWTFDPRRPLPGRGARRMWVRLGPGPCSSGMSQNARARKPIFRRVGERLLMTILLEPPQWSTLASCIGVIEPPLEVKLPRPLGKRRLYDGATYPPGNVVRIWREQQAFVAGRSRR